MQYAQWHGPSVTKPNPENCKNCSSKCAYDCAQLQYTIQNRTVLIISPLSSRQTSQLRCCLSEERGSLPRHSPCDGRTHQSSRIFPATGFWVCFVGDVGRRGATSSHVKNLMAETWRSTRGWSLGIDPTASTATHSSFIEVPSTSQVCVCVRVCVCVCVEVHIVFQCEEN